MRLRQLIESPSTAVFAFGRMNPPTIGHKKLADKVKSIDGSPFLFLTHSQKPKTDPLTFAEKVFFATKSFGDGIRIGDNEVRTIIQAMQKTQIFAYPSIWEETCCISAIEAMAAGNMAVVTNFGALFETCTDYAHYVNYETDMYTLAKKFKVIIEFVADNYHEPVLHERLKDQMKYYRTFYNGDMRAK